MRKQLFLVLAVIAIMMVPTVVFAEESEGTSKFRVKISGEMFSLVNDSTSLHLYDEDSTSRINDAISRISNCLNNLNILNSQDLDFSDENLGKDIVSSLDIGGKINKLNTGSFNFDANLVEDEDNKVNLNYSVESDHLSTLKKELSSIACLTIKGEDNEVNVINSYYNEEDRLSGYHYNFGTGEKLRFTTVSALKDKISSVLSIYDDNSILDIGGSNEHLVSTGLNYDDGLLNKLFEFGGRDTAFLDYTEAQRALAHYSFSTQYGNIDLDEEEA